MLGATKARYFSEFEISPLAISKQQEIAAMNELAMKEIRLLRQLADEKERYYSLTIERTHKEMRGGT